MIACPAWWRTEEFYNTELGINNMIYNCDAIKQHESEVVCIEILTFFLHVDVLSILIASFSNKPYENRLVSCRDTRSWGFL